MQFVKALPFQEALDKIGRRSPIGSRLSSSEWSDVPVALRERAFFSSRVESVRFLQRGRDGIADFLQENREDTPRGPALATGSRAAFVDQMQEFLAREGVERGAGGLRDITSERRLGLIFDVQTQQADGFGFRRQGLDPDVLNEFPAQRFIRVREAKEPRDWHVQFEDQVYLTTDPIWKTINRDFGVPWGPWGWGCGHDVEDVDRDEAESLGLVKPGQRIEPPKEDFNDNLQASALGLDPDLVAKLKEEFLDRLIVEGDAMRWNPEAIGREQIAGLGGLRQHPVSEALDLKVYGTHKDAVQAGLTAIERVHDTAPMRRVPLGEDTNPSTLGYTNWVKRPDGSMFTKDMGVRSTGKWPALTTVHEAGHYLDLEGIGQPGRQATRSGHADMTAVLAAAEQTEAIQGLRRMQSGTPTQKARVGRKLWPEEIWARSYAQYIAQRSGSPRLLRELGQAIDLEPFRQWNAADFTPISNAIDALLKNKGWL